jgi:hypothetical protein
MAVTKSNGENNYLDLAKRYLMIAISLLLVGFGASYYAASNSDTNAGIIGTSFLLTGLFFVFIAKDRYGSYRDVKATHE